MATTMIPEAASVKPSPNPPSGGMRFVLVRANLLPDAVISARQAVVVRKQVLVGLVVLVALLIGWFAASWWQTTTSRGKLDDLQRTGVALQNQQNEFGPLVTAQSNVLSIHTQLQNLMVGDLSWKTMLTTLRAQAPARLTLTNVSGTMSAGAASTTISPTNATGNASLNQTGKQAVGTLTITGSAPDKNSVATYADRLAKVKGLAAPLVTNIAATAGKALTFTVSAIITSDALGGRYTAPAHPAGGK